MMDVTTRGLPRGIAPREIKRAIRETFKVAKKTARGGVAVSCITDRRMTQLNRLYRHKNKSTDVLSFLPAEGLPRKGDKDWGDIFISPAYVRGEAKRRGILFKEEVLRMTVHGMLHLLGYDHVTDAQETRMFGLQEKALARALNDL